MLNFDFFLKRVWEYYLHYILCMIFQKMCFSCYILLTEQISLSDCVEILDNICIEVAFFSGCDVIKLGINLIFLTIPFLYMTKNGKKLNILTMKRAFKVK